MVEMGRWGPSVTLCLQPLGWVQVLRREKSPWQMLWILGNKWLGCDAEAVMTAGEAAGGHTRRHRPTKGFATRHHCREVQG